MEKRYTGELAKPLKEIPWGRHGLYATDEDLEKISQEAFNEEAAKLILLFDHYEIDHKSANAFVQLARCLARTHVPGLKRIRKAGAPQTWSLFDYCNLKIEVDDLRAKQKVGTVKSVKWACGIVAKQEPWKSRVKKLSNPVEALRRAYYKADPEWAASMRRVRAQHPRV